MVTCPSRSLRSLVALLVLQLVAAGATAEIVVRLATPAPHGSPWHSHLLMMAERWREASDGEVRLRVYPGGVAGDEVESVGKLLGGEVDALELTNIGLGVIAPESQVLSIPMLFQTYEEFDYVRQAMTADLEEQLRDSGVVSLAWSDAGWIRFFSSSVARTAAEFQSLKLFTWRTDEETLSFWAESGFKPVGRLSGSLEENLREGTVETLPMTAVGALVTQAFSAAPNMLDLRWAPSLTGVLISSTVWQSLPADLRPRLASIARDVADELSRSVRDLERESLEMMRQHGLEIHRPSAETEQGWRETALRTHSLIRGEIVAAETFDRALVLVEEYRRRQIENVDD